MDDGKKSAFSATDSRDSMDAFSIGQTEILIIELAVYIISSYF